MTFYDLCVPYKDVKYTCDSIDYLARLGYGGVAITQTVDQNNISSFKNILPDNIESNQQTNGWMKPNTNTKKMEIYNRVNFIIEDLAMLKKVESLNRHFINYHIIGIVTKEKEVFENIVILPWVDIITYKVPPKNKVKVETLRKGFDKGIHFEIQYSSLFNVIIGESSFFSISSEFIRSGKGKNLIISGNCERSRFSRSPYDIQNLMSMLGMTNEQVRISQSDNAKSVILKGLTRRTHCGIVDSFPSNKLKDLEKWKAITDIATTPTKNYDTEVGGEEQQDKMNE